MDKQGVSPDSFLGLIILFTSVFYISGGLGIDSDGSFHFSRAEEIYRNLKEGSFFTFIATHISQ